MAEESPPLKSKKGDDLIVKNQQLTRFGRIEAVAAIIFIVLFVFLLTFPVLLPELLLIEDVMRYSIGLVTALFFSILVIFLYKSREISSTFRGTNLAILHAYQAYMSLEVYLDPAKYHSKLKNLENAKKELYDLSYDVGIGWRDFIKFNEILPNLDTNMDNFVNSLIGLSLALEKNIHSATVIQYTLIVLIEFLESGKKNDFTNINKELEKYHFLYTPTSPQQQIKEFFLEKKILMHTIWISIFLVISTIPVIFIYAVNPEWIIYAIPGSIGFAAILVGSYVRPLIKKISEPD